MHVRSALPWLASRRLLCAFLACLLAGCAPPTAIPTFAQPTMPRNFYTITVGRGITARAVIPRPTVRYKTAPLCCRAAAGGRPQRGADALSRPIGSQPIGTDVQIPHFSSPGTAVRKTARVIWKDRLCHTERQPVSYGKTARVIRKDRLCHTERQPVSYEKTARVIRKDRPCHTERQTVSYGKTDCVIRKDSLCHTERQTVSYGKTDCVIRKDRLCHTERQPGNPTLFVPTRVLPYRMLGAYCLIMATLFMAMSFGDYFF